MITQRCLMQQSSKDFKVYRSSNNVATTIEYHWPNSDGSMGARRKMEVIDAAYRFDAAWRGVTPSNTKSFSRNSDGSYKGNDGTGYIYNGAEYDEKTPISLEITNELICSQWKQLYSDYTAKYNTDLWFNAQTDNKYAACKVRNTITADSAHGKWDIPTLFQLIVIWCCSDKIDELDSTFSSNKDKGIGCNSSYGRFTLKFSNTTDARIWSSSDVDSCVQSDGWCWRVKSNMLGNGGVIPIREL